MANHVEYQKRILPSAFVFSHSPGPNALWHSPCGMLRLLYFLIECRAGSLCPATADVSKRGMLRLLYFLIECRAGSLCPATADVPKQRADTETLPYNKGEVCRLYLIASNLK